MYNSKAYKTVLERFDKRRLDRAAELEATKKKVVARIPQIETIDAELARMASQAVMTAFSAESDKARRKILRDFRERSVELQAQKLELLVTGGFPDDCLDEKVSCKKCGDRGFIGTKMCECFRKELNRECYMRTRLASIIAEQNFKSFDFSYFDDKIVEGFNRSSRENMQRVYDYCKGYATDFSLKSPNLLFVGQPGLGKTFMSSSVAKEVIDRGFYVLYDSCQEILSRLEAAHFRGAEDDSEALTGCELLIIDDLGAEFKTSFSEAALYNIINSRLVSGLPTIISTNLSTEELAERYHERICSRLLGEYKSLLFIGTDIRLQKLAKASRTKKKTESRA